VRTAEDNFQAMDDEQTFCLTQVKNTQKSLVFSIPLERKETSEKNTSMDINYHFNYMSHQGFQRKCN